MNRPNGTPLIVLLSILAALVFVLAATPSVGPAAAEQSSYFVRVPAGSAGELDELNLNPETVTTYQSFHWLELSPTDYQKLAASDIPHTLNPDGGHIQITGFKFDPLADGEPALPAALANQNLGAGLRLVQFVGPLKGEWLAGLETAGLRPLQYYPHNAYLVWGTADQALSAESFDYVRWQGAVHPAYKINSDLFGRTGLIENVDVMFYNDGDIQRTLNTLVAMGATLELAYPSQPDKSFYNAVIKVDAALLDDIARLDEVLWLGFIGADPILDDEMSSQIIAGNHPGGVPQVGYFAHLANLGYDGTGVIWSVTDTGVDYNHPDLTIVGGHNYPGCNQANPGDDPSSGGHGTHVAGIIGGDATGGFTDVDGFLYGLGMAPGYSIFAQNPICGTHSSWPPAGGWEELSKQGVLGNAIGANNSWTSGEGTNHGYQATERTHDFMVRDGNFDTAGTAEPYILVFSAGNSGPGSNTLTSPKEAKNLIVVAGTQNYRVSGNIDAMYNSSSRGPAVDGRYVPTIATPGQQIASTRNDLGGSCGTAIPGTNGLYSFCTGTSMAAPHAAGTIVLATEWWRTWNGGNDPSPAMAKALLVNSAVDISGAPPIPNFDEGWGRVNATAIISPGVSVVYRDQLDVFDNTGETWTLNVGVVDPGKPLKVTVAWGDAPGAVGANPALVNNLNLTVEVGGDTYLGNVFSGGWSATGGTADTLNNLENVFVQNPSGGVEITIEAVNIAGDGVPISGDTTDQDFAIICYNCALFPDFTLDAEPDALTICTPTDAIYDITVGSILGYVDVVTLSALNNPAGTTAAFSPNSQPAPYTSTLTVGNTGSAAFGSYSMDIVGVAPTSTHTTTVGLDVYTAVPGGITLQTPADMATDVTFNPLFEWTAATQGVSYTLEIADDMAFSNIVYSTTILTTEHQLPIALSALTTFYWRVTAHNICGAGATSTVFSFTTQESSLQCNAGVVDFNVGIPADWTITSSGNTNVFWTDLAGCGEGGNWTGGTGDAACASSDLQGGGNYDTELRTPPIDLTGFGLPTLTYKANYQNNTLDFLDVDVSTNGGADWTTVLSWNEDHGSSRALPGEDITLDLWQYAGEEIIVRWRYHDPSGSTVDDLYVQIDDVAISCPVGPAIHLEKTVGTDPNMCAETDDIILLGDSEATYCYEVTNTGTVTLTTHDLDDTALGSIFSGLSYNLTPAASVFVTQTAMLTQTVVNTATWTAYNTGPADVISATDTARVKVIQPAQLPVNEGFESGDLPDYMYSEVTTNGNSVGRVQVTTANPHSGSFALDIDTQCNAACSPNTLQAAILTVDLGSVNQVILDFWVDEHSDENNPEDGVFVSDDGGATWELIHNLQNSPQAYTNVLIDLDAAVAAVGMNLVDSFLIKFQSLDNFAVTTDGYSFDDILIFEEIPTPDINVTPGSLSSSQFADEVMTETLTIQNTGDLVLNWSLDEAPGDCNAPSDVPWVSASPTSGSIPDGGSTAADVVFDSTGMTPGVYTAQLCVDSDDPDEPTVEVELTLTVEERPVINVSTGELSGTVGQGESITHTLTLTNSGDADLDWLIIEGSAVTAGGCGTPGDLSWVAVDPTSGTTAPGDSDDVTVVLDATGLEPGEYEGELCLTSNAPDSPEVVVNLNLTVTQSEFTIFMPAVHKGEDTAAGQPVGLLPLGALFLLPAAVFGWRKRQN